MKNLFRSLYMVLLMLFMAGLMGCQEDILAPKLEEPKEIKVHFQGVFNKDDVMAVVDRVTVYNENITTSPVLSVAAVVPVLFKQQRQQLRVYVNQSDSGTFEVKAVEVEAVIVRYNRETGEVIFEESDGDIIYF